MRLMRPNGASGRYLPGLLLLGLAGAFCWQLATLGWRLLLPEPALPEPLSPVARTHLPAPSKPDYRAIAAAHLFGQPPLPVNPKEDILHAPPTRLKLQLRGVILTEEPGDARAIIAAPGQPERAYALGADVPGGATLEAFYPDQVILKRAGRHETLRINIDDLPPGEIELGPPDAVDGVIDLRGDPEVSHSLARYRSQLLNDPVSLVGMVQLAPVTREGQLRGYRVRPDSNLAELDRFGLRAGDVITSVNGVDLTDPAAAPSLLQQLTVAEQLEINVLREEDLLSFYFQIDN